MIAKRQRHKARRTEKTVANKERSEGNARTALVLGGGAPNMPLMAGAIGAFAECHISFDVVSTSGAGGLAGLLWLAPKAQEPIQALRSVTTMSVTDMLYSQFPVNFKIFHKPGPLADWWRSALAANPVFAANLQLYEQSSVYAMWADFMSLSAAAFCPSGLTPHSWGLCAPVPFIEHVIDFDKIKDIKPHFYINAYNVTNEVIDNFPKHEITPDHFRAALAFPFIYGPYKLNGNLYYEGAVVDCLNFKDLIELHHGLKTIVVLDVLGTDSLIRTPRNLYDSWVVSMIIPLVKNAEDTLELFALKHNKGWSRSHGAKTDLLKLEFDVPDQHLPEVLDWSSSNAKRLFDIGYQSGLRFCETNGDKLRSKAEISDLAAD